MKTKLFLIAFLLSSNALANNYYLNLMLNSAKKGQLDAKHNLGEMYEYGHYVERDYEKAYRWYLEAAEQGYVKSQLSVGLLYDDENFEKKDVNKAANWYELAANNGCADAQYYIGYAFEKGEGREKDFSKALQWYKQAAVQGESYAMVALSRMYRQGLGVKANAITAKDWLNNSRIQEQKNKKTDKDLCVESAIVKKQRLEAEKIKLKENLDLTDYPLSQLKFYVQNHLASFYGLNTLNIKVDPIFEEENDNLFFIAEENRQYERKTYDYHIDGQEKGPKYSVEHARLNSGQLVNLAVTFSLEIDALDKNGKKIYEANLHPAAYLSDRLLFKDSKKCENYAIRAKNYVFEIFNNLPELTLKNVSYRCFTTYK